MTPETAQTVTIVLVVLGVLCCCVLPLGLLAGYCLCCKKKFEEASIVRQHREGGEASVQRRAAWKKKRTLGRTHSSKAATSGV